MDFYTLIFMGLIGTVCSSPVCPNDCKKVDQYHHCHIEHISKLGETSVAPWSMTVNVTEGREPEKIPHVMCRPCTVENMIAKPIVIQIQVYQRIRQTSEKAWCRCPYKVAVGCTCVNERQQ